MLTQVIMNFILILFIMSIWKKSGWEMKTSEETYKVSAKLTPDEYRAFKTVLSK